MSKYIYTSSEIIKILKAFTPLVEVFSIDEAFMDVTETKDRFRLRSSSFGGQVGGEIAIAKEIKRNIREKFHLTCSIGIGPNKLLAKLAGELKKPDGLVRLGIEDLDSIRDIPVEKLCGVGRKLEEYLGQMEIKTFGDLNRFPREKLVKRFGAVWGEQLHAMGQGKDNSPVLPSSVEEAAKSMGHSYTLPHPTTNPDEAKCYLLRLSEQVGRRLRKDSYKGNVIHTSLGFKDLSFWGKQKKIEDYLDDGYEIYKIAESLIDQYLTPFNPPLHQRWRGGNPSNAREGVRFVGVTVSSLIHHLDQISLLPQKEANKKTLKAVDEINNRYGEFTVERAAIMKTVIHEKTGMVAPRRYQVSC